MNNTPPYPTEATRWTEQLLQESMTGDISDIHLEPFEQQYRVRLRKQGLLQTFTHLKYPFAQQIIMHLKVISHLNIAEKRLPQDGRLFFSKKHPWQIRISISPSLIGEKIVLRLLQNTLFQKTIASLGMTQAQETLILNALKEPAGLIIVTGPTGAGKTTTLYAMLEHLNAIEKNIVTIEDPVEILLPGIHQVPINPTLGLTFKSLLRTLLRQDPDVIMIGEIRDPETARTAIEAAKTGHLVLTTLHTKNTAEAISRLNMLSVQAQDLRDIQPLVISQRLLRKKCQQTPPHATPSCVNCHQGYTIRTGIFEMRMMTDINSPPPDPTLREAGQQKIQANITTKEELNRVLGQEK